MKPQVKLEMGGRSGRGGGRRSVRKSDIRRVLISMILLEHVLFGLLTCNIAPANGVEESS